MFVKKTIIALNVLICVCMTVLIQLPIASAHAYVIGSDPVDGSTIAKLPNAVHIYFNAAISPLSHAHVYYVQGAKLIDVGATSSEVMPSHPQELIIPLKHPTTQSEGSYEVNWTAVANDDAHITYGIIGFAVGFSGFGTPVGPPVLGPSTSNDLEDIQALDVTVVLAMVVEWLVFVALTAWVGMVVMEQLILTGSEYGTVLLPQVRKRTSSFQRLCLQILLYAEGVELLLRAIHLAQIEHSNSFPLAFVSSLITQTTYGHIWLLRMILIALIIGLQRWKTRFLSDGGVWLLLAGLLSLLSILTSSAVQVLQPHLSVIVVDWLQTIAQGIWFGCFAYLGSFLLPILRTKDRNDDLKMFVTVQKWLTPFLLASMAVQLFSVFFLSDTSIHDLQQWLTDPYGRTQAVQVSILAIMVLLSIYVLAVLCPRIADQTQLLLASKGELTDRRTLLSALTTLKGRFKRIANMLALLGAGALLCCAVMDFFAPPIVFPDINYANLLAPPTSADHAQIQQIGSFSVTLDLLPGRFGKANTVIMLINDRNGNPITDAQVQLAITMPTMNMPAGHALIIGGNPVYATTFGPHQTFGMTGAWIVTIKIQRPNQQAVRGIFQVSIS